MNMYMKNSISKIKLLAFGFILAVFSSCSFFEVDETIDPNNPDANEFLENPTAIELNQLAIGVFGSMRGGFSDYFRITGSLGREIYVFASTESRWYTELLGTAGVIDNSNFLNAYFPSFFTTVRRAALFSKSANTSVLLTENDKKAISGFSKTIQAFGMLHALNMQGENGIRVDLEDIFNPGPIVGYDEALVAIKTLLDEGYDELTTSTTAFPFTVPSGFSAYATPANFAKYNRALAARVTLYQEDWDEVLNVLPLSYMNLTGSLTASPLFTYGNAPDVNNPLFQRANTNPSTLVAVHPDMVASIQASGSRSSKILQRTTPRSLGGLTGTHESALYATNTTSIPLLKNEELILIYAEALAQTGETTEAIDAINIIRNAYGLVDYAGPEDLSSLIDEILNQRKVSLFYEGHRWIDMRRYNRLDELPLDLETHIVFDRMPIPFAELQWDQHN